MFVLILCAVLALLGLSLVAFNPTVDGDIPTRPFGIAGLLIALLIFAMFSWTAVGAKNVGVLTTFGKPSDRTLGPGFHLTWPWQKTTEIDGTVQTNEYAGDDCIYVRIGDGSRSCLTSTIRWRIVPEQAHIIYGDYRDPDFDNPVEAFRSAVISKQFKSAAQAVLSAYNPVADLEVVEGSNAQAAADLNFAPDYDQVAEDLQAQMVDRLGDEPLAEIESVSVSYVSLSDSTQATIDDFIAAVGETRIAAQRKSTANEEAQSNEILSDSISNDPNVLVSKCLDLLADALESDYALPAGFSCWGSSTGVVIPGGGR